MAKVTNDFGKTLGRPYEDPIKTLGRLRKNLGKTLGSMLQKRGAKVWEATERGCDWGAPDGEDISGDPRKTLGRP
jgi:hypothetical protein